MNFKNKTYRGLANMSIMTSVYDKSRVYAEDIMNAIELILKKNNINHTIKSNGLEIVVNQTGYNKDNLVELICKKISAPKMVFNVLVDVVEIDDIIFIRQITR